MIAIDSLIKIKHNKTLTYYWWPDLVLIVYCALLRAQLVPTAAEWYLPQLSKNQPHLQLYNLYYMYQLWALQQKVSYDKFDDSLIIYFILKW